jgi:hypothetical protein
MQKLQLAMASLVTVAVMFLGATGSSQASTIVCCDMSSDSTPAGDLDATFDFSVVGATLFLELTNDTVAPNDFNINELYFNAATNVTSLTLTAATHSTIGDVLVHWDPVMTNVMEDGFGDFDFAIMDGNGETDPWLIGSGENILFELAIGGTAPFDMNDFGLANIDGYTLGAKFVNGPGDDSAWGANVPEPSTALLMGLGSLILGISRRRTLT